MNIVLLGGPGSGKGTQAKILSDQLSIPHVSSGDIFRENLENRTALGKEADAFISKGQLVPDSVTIRMIRQRLAEPDCAEGFILDGFPRTVSQAEALDAILVDRPGSLFVLLIVVSPPVLLKRLSGRWICRQDGLVYHELFNPPQVPGKCDVCGAELYQRPDDQPEVQKKRIEVYVEQTAPLIDFYRARGNLVEIDGEQDIQGVHEQIWQAVRSFTKE